MSFVIARTPFRVSFFGGGTDYPAWYRREGGAVLSTTIDKYCYVSCRYLPPFFSIKHRIVWRHIELVSSIAEILNPVVREALPLLGFDDSRGLEIHYQGDIPSRSGMGTSSAFAVGLINALTALKGGTIAPRDLALAAMALEQERLRETVGAQDQTAAAYGGLNEIRFDPDGTIEVRPAAVVPPRLEALEANLMLFFTGLSRLATSVAADGVAHLDDRAAVLHRMRAQVGEALALLEGDGDLDDVGRLLDEGWHLKRSLAPGVSTDMIDGLYAKARDAGALGGKLLGAGGGGFLLLYAPPDAQPAVAAALEPYGQVPFRFESRGSTLLSIRDP